MASRSRRESRVLAAVAVRVEEAGQRLLGVADQERVEEVGDRLRVGGAGAAAEHDRIRLPAVALPDGQPREVEHVQDVRVVELRLEREPEHVEVGRRARRTRSRRAGIPAARIFASRSTQGA